MPKIIDTAQKQEVAVLKAAGKSVNQISKVTSLHHQTIKRVIREPMTQQMVLEASEILATRMIGLVDDIITSIGPEDIMKAGLRDRIVSLGILQDKIRASYCLDSTPLDTGSPVKYTICWGTDDPCNE